MWMPSFWWKSWPIGWANFYSPLYTKIRWCLLLDARLQIIFEKQYSWLSCPSAVGLNIMIGRTSTSFLGNACHFYPSKMGIWPLCYCIGLLQTAFVKYLGFEFNTVSSTEAQDKVAQSLLLAFMLALEPQFFFYNLRDPIQLFKVWSFTGTRNKLWAFADILLIFWILHISLHNTF